MRLASEGAGEGSIGTCTGTMIAPNLVLTARHCVTKTDRAVRCFPDGTAMDGKFYDDTDPSQLYVYAGKSLPLYRNPTGRDAPNGIGVKYIHDGGSILCGHDVALIVLQEPIAGVKIAPIRLDAPPAKDDALLAVGWGMTTTYKAPPIRQQRETAVAWVGTLPESDSYSSTMPVEFATGEGACFGDSGGPALAKSTGAVVGVGSRHLGGGNGEPGTVGRCTGSEVRVGYSHTAGFKDLLLKGFEAAGAVPWIEGQSNPHLGKSGAACTKDDACLSGACIAVGKSMVCAPRDCKSEACPSGYACGADDAGKPLCAAVPKPGPIVIEETSCTLRSSPGRSGRASLLGAILVAASFVARRRFRTTP